MEQLLARGVAYHDYATPEEMKAEREIAEREKQPYVYSRRWLAATPQDAPASKQRAARGSSG